MNEMKTLDEIRIDTEAWKNESLPIQQTKIPLFELVAEDHTALRTVLPDFDFSSPPVNPNEFASSLVETCKKHGALGLSANQCGFTHRVFVMGTGDNFVAFFNPKITSSSVDRLDMEEGCLTFMDLFLKVKRPSEVYVEYQDYLGETKTAHYTGLTARVFQHELDHLNGIVYHSHVKPLALQMANKKRVKIANMRGKYEKAMIKKVKAEFNANKLRNS